MWMFRARVRPSNSAIAFLVLGVFWTQVGTLRADYALQDGDVVVFLGDSITAARTYGKIVENYTLLRYPQRRVRFHNAGWGGDTAAGGLARLERDVWTQQPTVLIVAYGTNDIGWGALADEAHKQRYLQSLRGIVEQSQARKVRVYLCSAAVTAQDPETSEDSFLQKMCDEGMALARELGERSIDVQRTMREIQKRAIAVHRALNKKEDPAGEKAKHALHVADGVHLNDLGQLAMAFAILKGLDAPADVSSLTLDAPSAKVVSAVGCEVSELQWKDGQLSFVRLDEGRPINFGLFGALQFASVPIPDQLNRYLLTIKNLAPGKYQVRAEERLIGTFTAQQLAQGLNISSLTPNAWQPGGPWDAEATVLARITEARSELNVAEVLSAQFLSTQPQRALWLKQRAEANRQLEDLQRTLVRPVPYHFVVRPAGDDMPKKQKPPGT